MGDLRNIFQEIREPDERIPKDKMELLEKNRIWKKV